MFGLDQKREAQAPRLSIQVDTTVDYSGDKYELGQVSTVDSVSHILTGDLSHPAVRVLLPLNIVKHLIYTINRMNPMSAFLAKFISPNNIAVLCDLTLLAGYSFCSLEWNGDLAFCCCCC